MANEPEIASKCNISDSSNIDMKGWAELKKVVRMFNATKYYCLLQDYSCEVGTGEDCDAGSAKGRHARTRDPTKCPYRVEKTW
jgi:hypothetical protein